MRVRLCLTLENKFVFRCFDYITHIRSDNQLPGRFGRKGGKTLSLFVYFFAISALTNRDPSAIL